MNSNSWRRPLIKNGLQQIDNKGLRRIIKHETPMLLDGRIYDDNDGRA